MAYLMEVTYTLLNGSPSSKWGPWTRHPMIQKTSDDQELGSERFHGNRRLFAQCIPPLLWDIRSYDHGLWTTIIPLRRPLSCHLIKLSRRIISCGGGGHWQSSHTLPKANSSPLIIGPNPRIIFQPSIFRCYCWWKKSCTSWYGEYPVIYMVCIHPTCW